MRIFVVLLVIGAAVAAPSIEHRDKRNIKDFVDQFLKEAGIIDLLPWIQDKIKNDPDSERVIAFFKGQQWTNIKSALKSCPGYDTVNDKLQKEGIDLVELLEKIKKFVVGETRFQARRPLGEHLNEFLDKIDLENIMVLVQTKLDTDSNMQKVIDFLNSDDNKKIEQCLQNNQDVKDIIEELYDEGVDVKKLVEMFKALFGVTRYYNQARNVADMLQELVKETGLDQLLSWFQKLIASDPDVQRIVEFFRGNEWKTVKEDLQKCPNYQLIKEKVKNEGIDVNQVLDDIKNFVVGGNQLRFSSRRSLGDLLNEVLGKLDIDKIMVAIQDRLENDADMKKLVNFLKSDDFKAIVDCMRKSPQVQDLVAELKDEGVDIVRLVHVLKAIFGSDD